MPQIPGHSNLGRGIPSSDLSMGISGVKNARPSGDVGLVEDKDGAVDGLFLGEAEVAMEAAKPLHGGERKALASSLTVFPL